MIDPFILFDWGARWVVVHLLGWSVTSPQGVSLHFFLYDTLKILVLLAVISFGVAFVKSYFSPERTRALLSGKAKGVGNVAAAGLGIVTPFCSCSAVPLFIGFVQAGVPLGVTFSYLISAPMVNEVAVILLWGLFGFQVAALYIVSGLILAIVSGFVLGSLGLERYVVSFATPAHAHSSVSESVLPWRERLCESRDYAREIVAKVWPYVLVGVGLGALIHGYVPTDFLLTYAGRDNPWAVPIAVLLGVPLYANVAGVLPITEALVQQGLPIGTVLAFTMAVTALSFPEMILLKRVLKVPLLLTFVGILAVGIVAVGYLFNAWIQ